MRKILIGSLLLVGLVVAGEVIPAASTAPAAERAGSRETETRIAIKSCTARYTSQRDVVDCLARQLPATQNS
jgi:hypothetical protein